MFIENRKRTRLSAALIAIGLVSAAIVLLAHPLPLITPNVATASTSAPENRQTTPERSPNTGATKPAPVTDAQPRSTEKDLIRLAELQADADLLEITLDGQKAGILRSIQFLGGRVSRYTVQDRNGDNDWQQSLLKVDKQLARDQESYKGNKIKLVLLKYQIARESKALGLSLDATAPLTELNRRLDRLEEKIDRLSGKAGP